MRLLHASPTDRYDIVAGMSIFYGIIPLLNGQLNGMVTSFGADHAAVYSAWKLDWKSFNRFGL